MRLVAHLADSDDAIAFAAFHTLIAPALRDAARGPLRRARHAGRACHGTASTDWCADCEADIDDLLLDIFTRLRTTLLGPTPSTRSGETVRELALVREHLTNSLAGDQDAAAFSRQLRGPGEDAEPRWLRAVRAQLIHYPLNHLEERTRRADAVRRGAAARPDRDLRTAAWAAPLREDPVELDLLLLAVFRARRGGTDLYDVPADVRDRHGLSRAATSRRMTAALAKLKMVNPGFFAANVADPRGIDPLPADAPQAAADPQERAANAAACEAAREELHRLVSGSGEASADGHSDAYRAVVAAVCAAGDGSGDDPVGVAVRSLGLAPEGAGRLVRRLVTLTAAAGPEWTTRLTTRRAGSGRSPRATKQPPRRAGGRPASGGRPGSSGTTEPR